ncbi:hypothetical protein ACFL6S_03480 [Candidatus Poribacteria bacterium]
MGKITLGRAVFLGAILLTLLMSLVTNSWIPVIVGVLGIAVGVLNVSASESQKAILIAIGLGIVGIGALAAALSSVPVGGDILSQLVTNVGTLFTTIAATSLLVAAWKTYSR